MNLSAMLQRAIQKENQRWYELDVAMAPEERLRRAYTVALQAINQLVTQTEQTSLAKSVDPVDQSGVLRAYVAVIDGFFQVAARQSWSQLIVMTDSALAKLGQKPRAKSLNQQVLSIEELLLKSHFERQQPAFEHAWHLVLKWGLVDLGLQSEAIENAFLNDKRTAN